MDPAIPRGEELPEMLTDRAQWVCWREEERDGRPTKVPVDPNTGSFASTTDPATWSEFDEARAYAAQNQLGLGFVFTADDTLVGIDLDKCHVAMTGTATEWAQDIIERLDSYTEVSPSGTGFHIILEGELPEGGNRRGDIEMYAHSRYFTVTGEHVASTPTEINERSEALASVHREYILEDIGADVDGEPEGTSETGEEEVPRVEMDDETLLSRARKAQNGAKFGRLWRGSTAGYDSHSEADMALCAMLAFWTGGDANQMDRLFRDSGLCREKWDEVHFADGSTYGEKTVERAIAGTSEFYAPGLHGEDDETAGRESPAPHRVEPRSRRSSPTASEGREWHEVIEELSRSVVRLERENDRLTEELEAERASRRLLEAQLEDERGPTSLWRRLTHRSTESTERMGNLER